MEWAGLAAGEHFRTRNLRVINVGELDRIVAGFTPSMDSPAAIAKLDAAGVPAAELRDPDAAIRDPRVPARGETARMSHPKFSIAVLGPLRAKQSYAMIGAVLNGRETGPAMGIVSLGVGIYSYLEPQLIGLLRDWTGGFVAGFHMLVGAARLGVILMLAQKRSEYRRNAALRGTSAAEVAP
jgi:hypothetical protein